MIVRRTTVLADASIDKIVVTKTIVYLTISKTNLTQVNTSS